MTTVELKRNLINKIKKTENSEVLEEMFRLIQNEEPDNRFYKLSELQLAAVEEARQQFRNGQFLTSDQAEKDIEEWLGK